MAKTLKTRLENLETQLAQSHPVSGPDARGLLIAKIEELAQRGEGEQPATTFEEFLEALQERRQWVLGRDPGAVEELEAVDILEKATRRALANEQA